MNQQSLFDPLNAKPTPARAPYAPGSITSKAAAESVAPRIGGLRAAVLRFFIDRGRYGATDDEAAEALALPDNTLRPRRRELVEIGCLANSGEKRKTRSNCGATVWRYTGKPASMG